MFYPYDGSFDTSLWKIAFPVGEYALSPTERRSGGPVLFTSRKAAIRFLNYHEERWGEKIQGIPLPLGMNLKGARAHYSKSYWNEESDGSLYLWLDLREPFGMHGEFDAEYLTLAERED